MTDPQGAAQRLRAYLDAFPEDPVATQSAYRNDGNGEFQRVHHTIHRADLEAVLNDLDHADRAIENGNTETDKAYSQLRAANAKLAETQAELDRLQQEVQRQVDAKMSVAEPRHYDYPIGDPLPKPNADSAVADSIPRSTIDRVRAELMRENAQPIEPVVINEMTDSYLIGPQLASAGLYNTVLRRAMKAEAERDGRREVEKGAAEQAIARVRAQAAEWAELAPADDWGETPGDTAGADAGRYLLALIDQPERIADQAK